MIAAERTGRRARLIEIDARLWPFEMPHRFGAVPAVAGQLVYLLKQVGIDKRSPTATAERTKITIVCHFLPQLSGIRGLSFQGLRSGALRKTLDTSRTRRAGAASSSISRNVACAVSG
jgi:hypothetical protein